VVLSRAIDMDTGNPVVFTGDYATGPIVGTDLLNGFQVTLHTELAIPADVKKPAQHGPPGWGIFPVTQGAAVGWKCVGFQVDTEAGSETGYASR